MSVSAYLVFVEALLFLTLWLFACAYGTVVSTALASGCGTDLRGAVARIVPLAVATVSTSAVFAAPAFSVLTHSSNTASDVVRGVFLAAWLAQQNMRHKSRKTAFRAIYWATIVLHCAALAGFLYGMGAFQPWL